MNSQLLGDEIARIAAHLEAGEFRLLKAIGEFDAQGGWAREGAISCAHWLSWRIGLGLGPAREKVRVARVLPRFPRISKCFEEARLSYSKVRALTRVATADNEEALVEVALSSPASVLERICRKLREVIDGEREVESPEDADARRTFRCEHLANGRVRFVVDVPADEGAVLLAAVDRAVLDLRNGRREAATAVVAGDAPDAGRGSGVDLTHPTDASAVSAEAPAVGRTNRVDGLMIVAESYLSSAAPTRRRGPLTEVVLHVSPADLSTTGTGAFIDNVGGVGVPAETARRLACDAAVVTLTEDEAGKILDAGRRTRTVPVALRRALEARDEGCCTFPGCTNRLFLDAHHLVHWADGGETNQDNLVLLCRRHHSFVHEHRYTVVIGGDGRPAFAPPAGPALCRVWTPPAIVGDAVEVIAQEHTERGLELGAVSLLPASWDGEPADHLWINDVLCQATFRDARGSGGRSTT